MAKKSTTKKKTKKKTASSRPARKTAGSASRKTTRKPAGQKTSKKAASKKTASRAGGKKTVKKAPAAKKKTVKKAPASKPATKPASKQVSKKVSKKPVPASKAASKKTTGKKTVSKKTTVKKKSTRKSIGKDGRSVAAAAATATADKDGYVLINGRRVRMITKKVPTATPRKPRAAAVASEPVVAEKQKVIKTKLTAKELRGYRDLLLTRRAELVGDLGAMEKEALHSTGGNLSTMPIHMADIGTDTYDQDFMLNLAENERQRIREIDGALKRIEEKTYGVCIATGKQIPKTRLNAKPWAKYTIEAARRIEQGMNA